MKKIKIITAVLFILAVNTLYSQPTWVWQNPLPTGNDLNSVFFINSSTGFIGGNSGVLFRTNDGGTNWTAVNPGTTDDIKSIFFTDANTGYIGAGRFQCLLLKTTNGGLNWTQQNLGLQYGARSVNFIDANNGVAAYQTTNIIKTTNAGINWSNIQTSNTFVTAAWMCSPAIIYAVGSTGISKTTNGGANWVSQGPNTGDLLTVCFTDSLNGQAAGRNGLMLRTTNGGTNWNNITVSGLLDIYMVRYLNASSVFACAQGGAIGKSTNGGINWSVSNPTEAYFNTFYSIIPLNSNEVFVSGAYGTIIKSTNGGANWTQLFGSINNEIYYSHFTDDNNGYAASFNGVIKTTNGGANWVKLNSINIGGPLYYINSNTGYQAALNAGILYKTTNAGANFTQLISGYPASFRGIQFINNNTGFMTASNATTLKTTNGGINWLIIDSTADSYYTDLKFSDSLTAYICGYNYVTSSAFIRKTTNAGNNWFTQTLNSTLIMTNIHFVNNNTGFTSSNSSGQNFFKTTNGGTNWSPVGNYTNPIVDIYFVNENLGYLCGFFGWFYRTTNGGLNWAQITVPAQNNIRSIHHNNNTGVTYLLGAGGMILKSTNGSVTGFEQTGNNNPTGYYLSQNYPNPFNPVTNINFSIPNEQFVTLLIYDMLGREVETLVNENLTAGTHNVDWNAANYTSGVYFYRLISADHSETKRMVLVK